MSVADSVRISQPHVREHQAVEAQSDAKVLFIEDVADRLGMSVRTLARRIRTGTFPIPELQRLDTRRRWSSVDVDRWIATSATEKKSPFRVLRSK